MLVSGKALAAGFGRSPAASALPLRYCLAKPQLPDYAAHCPRLGF